MYLTNDKLSCVHNRTVPVRLFGITTRIDLWHNFTYWKTTTWQICYLVILTIQVLYNTCTKTSEFLNAILTADSRQGGIYTFFKLKASAFLLFFIFVCRLT